MAAADLAAQLEEDAEVEPTAKEILKISESFNHAGGRVEALAESTGLPLDLLKAQPPSDGEDFARKLFSGVYLPGQDQRGARAAVFRSALQLSLRKVQTKQLLRTDTSAALEAADDVAKFQQRNPYVKLESRGSFFVPPEAGEGGYLELDVALATQGVPGQLAAKSPVAQPTAKAPPSGLQTLEAFLDEATSIQDGPPQSVRNYTVVLEALVVPDDWADPRHCTEWGDLKPRRPMPHIRVSQLLSGTKRQKDWALLSGGEGNWIHAGSVNDWPAMQGLILVSLKSSSKQTIWTAKSEKPLPSAVEMQKAFGSKQNGTVTFLAPTWMSIGWLPDSPGFVYWFSEQHKEPRMLCGQQMLKVLREEDEPALRNAQVTNVHHYVHRYPLHKSQETEWNRREYHCVIVLEWEHGRFMTAIESAWRCGIGGFGGKTNWCEDKLSAEPMALRLAPAAMIRPWDSTRSEWRIWDVPFRTVQEFEGYLHKYSEHGGLPLAQQRFLAWERNASAPRRIRGSKAADVASYLLNYSQRLPAYNVPYSNCMTFATDFYAFLTGSRDFQPYSGAVRPFYTQHILSFVYAPSAAPVPPS